MAKYLISFPSAAMVVPDGEWEAVAAIALVVWLLVSWRRTAMLGRT